LEARSVLAPIIASWQYEKSVLLSQGLLCESTRGDQGKTPHAAQYISPIHNLTILSAIPASDDDDYEMSRGDSRAQLLRDALRLRIAPDKWKNMTAKE